MNVEAQRWENPQPPQTEKDLTITLRRLEFARIGFENDIGMGKFRPEDPEKLERTKTDRINAVVDAITMRARLKENGGRMRRIAIAQDGENVYLQVKPTTKHFEILSIEVPLSELPSQALDLLPKSTNRLKE